MLAVLEEHLLRRWRDWGLAGHPRSLRFVCRSRHIKLRFTVFREGESSPDLFVKTPRFRQDNGQLEREATRTSDAADLLRGSRLLVPELLDSPLLGARRWNVYRYLPCHSNEAIPSHSFRDVDLLSWLEHAVAVSTEVGLKTRSGDAGVVAAAREEAARALHECAPDELSASVLRSTSLWRQVVLVHGDLGVNNLVEAEGRLGLLDWEFSPGYGAIGEDMLFFVLHSGIYYLSDAALCAPADARAFLARLFGTGTFYSELVRPALQRYCLLMGCTTAELRSSMPLVLARLVRLCRAGVFSETPRFPSTALFDAWLKHSAELLP